MSDRIFTLIPILIGLMISLIPASIFLPQNYMLIWFGIVAFIMIGSIVYVSRLPNPVPNDKILKQLTNFGGIGLMLFMFGFSWAVVSNHLSTSPICLLAIGGTLIVLDVGSNLAKKINNHYTARPTV